MKQNTPKGGKKAKNYGGGSGMAKHRTAGVAHNHAVSIARVREENKRLEEEARLRAKRKGQMYGSVKEVFGGPSSINK